MRNIHSFSPTSYFDYCKLCCCYIPPLFSALLISTNTLPYHLFLLPLLRTYCTKRDVYHEWAAEDDTTAKGKYHWLFYYYCFTVMIVAEVMVFGNLLLVICTPPGYVPSIPWKYPPLMRDPRDPSVVRAAEPRLLNPNMEDTSKLVARLFAGDLSNRRRPNGGKGTGAADGPTEPAVEHPQNPHIVSQFGRNGRLRYCSACAQYQPDRAHHCDDCDRCVFQMDHHCPFVNNCVGRSNWKFFVLFVSFIPVGAFHIASTTLIVWWHLLDWSLDGDELTALALMGLVLLSTIMGIVFLCFAGRFWFLFFQGHTTMSMRVSGYVRGAPGPSRGERRHRFRREVCGRQPCWMLLLPIYPGNDDEEMEEEEALMGTVMEDVV